MAKKILMLILIFYFLALLQTSFFVHFKMTAPFFNFLFIVPIIINLLERTEGKYGIMSAGIGGFFLDIFSENPIGLSVTILLAISILIKFVLKKYVQIPAII